MATSLRIATWNLENLDDKAGEKPALSERIAVMRPQLERLRADVLILQEVHGQETPGQPRALRALAKLLEGTHYEGYELAFTQTKGQPAQPYDVRNLVVASRFPIIASKQLKNEQVAPAYKKVTAFPAEPEAKPVEWERPILHVKLAVAGRTLHVIDLHLKSRLPTKINGQTEGQYDWKSARGWAEGFFLSSMKRVGQALETRLLIDDIFDVESDAWIVVGGDLNADANEVPVLALRGRVEETGNAKLAGRVLFPCESSVPEPARYSLLHLGKGEMLDHLLVSKGLLSHYRGTEIHNETLPDESGAFRTDVKFPESDHAPVIAEFELP